MKVRWAVLALVGAVLAGCGSGAGTGSGRESGVPRVQSKGDFPELPLERYEFNAEDNKRMEEAESRLAQRCMRSFGFTDFPLNPEQRGEGSGGNGNSVALTISTVSPYGMLDLDHVRRWGYGFDPDRLRTRRSDAMPKGRALRQGEFEVLYGAFGTGRGGATAVVNGRKVPEGGCSGEAMRQVMGDIAKTTRVWAYVAGRTGKLDKAVAKDTRVRKAFRDWSRCVEDKGFKRYESPAHAFRDKAWRKGVDGGNTSRTKRELGTAVADVECNRKLNTAGVWWVVSAEKQRADLRRDKDRYDAVRKDQDRVRATVREVLGEE
ncbi:hypothetical protein AB0B50_11030 [Streptomyces sp. NPDC041068]|uniref:hypothetical protein n=1 Tax=Streptomyces sp. NPDC041068 TaxID=3155130 RepID=UPI0033F3EB9E